MPEVHEDSIDVVGVVKPVDFVVASC